MVYQKMMSGIIAVLFLFSTGFLFSQTQDEEFQQLYQEYLEINQRLQQIQHEALQDEDVSNNFEEYSKYLDGKLKETDSQAAELVDQRQETIESMEEAQEEGDLERIQMLQLEYEQLNRELEPYMQEVMADPDVQQERDEFETMLISKMEEIDPETIPLLERMSEISQRLDQMMQEHQE